MVDLLIRKNELEDDSYVMIMIKKYGNILSFMSIFQTTFGNVSCSSTNYLWFVLEHINKMHWDCCLFCDEPKREELRGKVKVSSKEKAVKEKKKIEET